MDEEKLARRIDRFMIIYVLAGSLLMLFQILSFYFGTQTDSGRHIFERWNNVVSKLSQVVFAVNLMNVITVAVFSFALMRKTTRVAVIGLLATGLFVFYIYLSLRPVMHQ
jgi:hypothetical protein